MELYIVTTHKYTSKKQNTPISDGLFHDFKFSLQCGNLQQDCISEDASSLKVFIHTIGKGASCQSCGHFSHRLHSYDSRHIEDLEVYRHALASAIKVGKYYYNNSSFTQKEYSTNHYLF